MVTILRMPAALLCSVILFPRKALCDDTSGLSLPSLSHAASFLGAWGWERRGFGLLLSLARAAVPSLVFLYWHHKEVLI